MLSEYKKTHITAQEASVNSSEGTREKKETTFAETRPALGLETNRMSLLNECLSKHKDKLHGSTDVADITGHSRLGDPYLPALNSFVHVHNVSKLNKDLYKEKVKQFKEERYRSQQRMEGKKLIEKVP